MKKRQRKKLMKRLGSLGYVDNPHEIDAGVPRDPKRFDKEWKKYYRHWDCSKLRKV